MSKQCKPRSDDADAASGWDLHCLPVIQQFLDMSSFRQMDFLENLGLVW